ncbi:hypothetical protein Tco_0043388, partial [Tanacetum coccineum]
MFTTINVISRNEVTQLYNEDIRNSESYKEYYAIASGTIPPKTNGSKKKANTDTITKQKPPTAPKEKKSGKGKQKSTELETISEADLIEAEQLKIITKRSRQETHSSHASSSGADEGTGESSDDDQDDEQAQDDEDAGKNDVNETTQDDDHDDDEKVQDDDEHDVDETVQEDDDEEQTESDDDGDDFVHPKLTTHDDDIIHEEDTDEDDSSISSSDDEDSDNEDEGTNVEGAKSDEEDQGNEAVEDTNTDLDGRDAEMTDVILPQVQATQEIEDTHVTLTPVNPDGQQQSSSVSSGFVSNMLNPKQDTGVDDIFRQHTKATSLIDTPVTAINRPPTPYPHVIQTQQPPIMTPATTTS